MAVIHICKLLHLIGVPSLQLSAYVLLVLSMTLPFIAHINTNNNDEEDDDQRKSTKPLMCRRSDFVFIEIVVVFCLAYFYHIALIFSNCNYVCFILFYDVLML